MDSYHAKTGARRQGRTRGPRFDPGRLDAVRQELFVAGQTIAAWAVANGEKPEQVYHVMSGDRACISGDGHRIAVKLGLKDGAPAPVACA